MIYIDILKTHSRKCATRLSSCKTGNTFPFR